MFTKITRAEERPRRNRFIEHSVPLISMVLVELTTKLRIDYRKRPCISRTFFHKIEAKNRGCGLSMDTSMFGVLKNLLNIYKTS